MKIDLEEMRKYERENFAVEVKPDRWDTGGTTLSVTHNGRQWMSISLLDASEIEAVINALQERLGGLTQHAAVPSQSISKEDNDELENMPLDPDKGG